MESKKFDDITKALATGQSRRAVLKGLAGGAAAALGLRRAAPTGAAPSCRALGEACKTTASCCNASGQTVLVCQQVGTAGAQRCECNLELGFVNCGGQCFNANCPAGATFSCENGCQCPTGSETCTPTGGTEQCFATCGSGTVRNPATCACECPSGQQLCNGSCVTSCTGGKVLVNCVCQCPTGTSTCTPTGGTAQCTTNCTGGQEFNANCQCVCPSGQELCGGQCVALCPSGQQRNADCTCGCPTGTVTCGGQCVTACTNGLELNASCQCVCPSGGELCQSTCHSACPAGQVRNATTCACACPTGTTTCGGQCVTACTNGLVLNSACQCVCPTVNGQLGIFCNGACHYDTECQKNTVFNAFCCSCQNPGQPSGRCK